VVGTVRIRLAGSGAGRGLVRLSLREVGSTELDGLPTTRSTAAPPSTAGRHPNGSLSIDHVVAFSPDLDRTAQALISAGLPLRRVREGPTPGGAMRQAFFRLGEVILEVIEHPEGTPARARRDDPARLWGMVFVVESLDECASELGERLGSPRDAVQPGRRIATLRRSAGLSLPVAFITPEVSPASRTAGSQASPS
jgi:hypothetical protein